MEPEYIELKVCRVCDSERILELGIERNFYLSNLDRTISLSYAICQDCFLIFQQEYVGDKYLNHYYSVSPMLRRKQPTSYEIAQNERQGEFLSRHVDLHGKKVLEIGAHAGAFLVYLNERYGCVTYYEELSEEAKMVLKTQKELKDFRGADSDKKVDILVLRHVLEHIHDLNSFLRYAHTIITDNGSFFIEVPDWSCFDLHTDPFIFEHLSQFNVSGLVQLFRRTGWEIEALEKSIDHEDPTTPNRVIRIVARPTSLPDLGSQDIRGYFNEFSATQHDTWKTSLNELVATEAVGKTVALYPASHLTFEALSETNIKKTQVLGLYDLDPKKQGQEFLGLNVFPPDQLKADQPDLIMIFTMAYEPEIRASFKEMGLTAQIISIKELARSSRE